MAGCAPSATEPFLTGTVHYLDCSARTIGAYGYAALGTSGGAATGLATAGLTIAIALFAIRLLVVGRLTLSAPVELVARIAIVLALAFSWPAVRTLFYDVVFDGPAQIAGAVTGMSTPPSGVATLPQLQAMDDSIQAFTAWGTGREELNAVRTATGQPAAQAFSAVAISDRLALGAARVSFLGSAVLLTGGLRLAGGILFALLPLLAVFLLFRPTEGIVLGWMRAILAVTLTSAAGAVLLAIETGYALPWLAQRVAERAQSLATPSAPTELLVIALTTSLMALLTTLMLTRVCFAHFPLFGGVTKVNRTGEAPTVAQGTTILSSSPVIVPARELTLAGAVSRMVVRDSRLATQRDGAGADALNNTAAVGQGQSRAPLSNRHHLRQSRASRLRSGVR